VDTSAAGPLRRTGGHSFPCIAPENLGPGYKNKCTAPLMRRRSQLTVHCVSDSDSIISVRRVKNKYATVHKMYKTRHMLTLTLQAGGR
jgi:hypothetical protein